MLFKWAEQTWTTIKKYSLSNHTENKSTQRAQTSLAEADHYPHIARIPDLESQQI